MWGPKEGVHVSQREPGTTDTRTRQAAGDQAAVVTQDPRGSHRFAQDEGPEACIGAGQTSQQRMAGTHARGPVQERRFERLHCPRPLCAAAIWHLNCSVKLKEPDTMLTARPDLTGTGVGGGKRNALL